MSLISTLESIFEGFIQKNTSKKRCSIYFDNNLELKRDEPCSLRISRDVIESFYSGKYVFSSSSIHIYQAIDSLLTYLGDRGLLNSENFEDEVTDLQEEYRIENS